MLDVCLLGTGGTMPLPDRALTSLMVRFNGKTLLIDCGEGTQVMIRRKGWSMKPIDTILLTHFHADHTAGLPGLLLSMGKSGRTEPLKIIGPRGIAYIVRSLCAVAPELPFEVEVEEISGNSQTFTLGEIYVNAFLVDHSVTCYGYSINIDRAGKFNPQKAEELGIEKRYWGILQRGETVEIDGRIYNPSDVLGAPRKGLKVTYCTDTRPTDSIVEFAKNSDLFICEGMYAEPEKLEKALSNKHLMFSESAETAVTANVREMWLTHYSPSLSNPNDYLQTVRDIFPNSVISEDLQSTTLKFG